MLIGLRKKKLATFGTLVAVKVTGAGEINYVPAGDKPGMHFGRRGPSVGIRH